MIVGRHQSLHEVLRYNIKPELKDAFEVCCIFLLEKKDSKSAYVVSEYFGFSGERKTLAQIAKLLGIKSSERVRQIRNRGLRRLSSEYYGPNKRLLRRFE